MLHLQIFVASTREGRSGHRVADWFEERARHHGDFEIELASLVNAIQHLVKEWAYKPVAFVSYGGVTAGTRGVQITK